jgi:ABC-type transport system involved in multi-copper enzyme maturation permease subunit
MRGFWLAILTLREAVLKGTLIFFFVVSNLILIFFLIAMGATQEGGTITISFFGNPISPRGIENFNPVAFILRQLFTTSTFWVLLFGLFATAGLIPSMLEKGTVELYLSKPLSRASLLLSRSAGACAGIILNLLYFALAIWLIFGLKTGIWHHSFLLAATLTIPMFFFYYSVVALTALISNSTGFSIMFALIFHFVSSALAVRERVLYPWWDNMIFHRFLDVLFFGTPQISPMIESAAELIGGDMMRRSVSLDPSPAGFDPWCFVFSFFSSALLYAVAAWYFSRKDY